MHAASGRRPISKREEVHRSAHCTSRPTSTAGAWFVRAEILRAKSIGLTGLREHVKVESPRKLYWADRLGLLIMADVPNSWGEPDSAMRHEAESTLRGMVARDYNHPAIFAWVLFNETWGLFTKVEGKQVYRLETQKWVASVYRAAKP